jgi:hypothetical protein
MLVGILLGLSLPPTCGLYDRLAIGFHRDLLNITFVVLIVHILHFDLALLLMLGVLVGGAV